MKGLRPYKTADAQTIVSWCRDEETFRKWTSDRHDSFPITAEDMNRKYIDANGDCTEPDNFYPMTAFDESGIFGHLILRYVGGDKSVLRIGFVIVDDAKRGRGYGKKMIEMAVKYAFEMLAAEKVTIGVFENNEPACFCYKAAGFRESAQSGEICELFGEKWRILELEITKEEYLSQH